MKNCVSFVLLAGLLVAGPGACALEVAPEDSEAAGAETTEQLEGLEPIELASGALESPTAGPTPDPWRRGCGSDAVSKPTPDPWHDTKPPKDPGVRSDGDGSGTAKGTGADQER